MTKHPDFITSASAKQFLRGSAMPRILSNARILLVGKKIASVGYGDVKGIPYPLIILEDGTQILAQMDDECNGPGSLALTGGTNKLSSFDDILCATSYQ